MLKEIAKRIPDIVFKGGTSLSKYHKVIQRFDEAMKSLQKIIDFIK